MSSVVTAIQELGVEVRHIPGGCTSLAQPIDVGVNKPLKNHVRRSWENYMITNGLGEPGRTIQPPTRKMMAEWIVAAIDATPAHIIRNAWRHGRYSYFPHEREEDIPTNQDQQAEDTMVEEEIGMNGDEGVSGIENNTNNNEEAV